MLLMPLGSRALFRRSNPREVDGSVLSVIADGEVDLDGAEEAPS